ncbi:MAG TPA: LamG-like jellyroll fold domain-containing protein [Verrucomicrobiae bacterium]|jgi:hypothetical protein
MKTYNSIKHKALIWCITALAGMQVTAWADTLVNRYSFNETGGIIATDSVSGANATLHSGTEGTASFNGSGQAVLFQNISEDPSTDTNAAWITLPPNILSNYTAVTIEAWTIPTLDETANPWTRIWDFGDGSGTGQTVADVWCRFGDNSGDSIELDSWTGTAGDNWNFSGATMNDGAENHVVWTGDANTHIAKLYLNGALVSTFYNFSNSPAAFTAAGGTTNDWLGRSEFADPLANASYDEFRIYSNAISALQVAADYQGTPDTYPASYGTVTSIVLSYGSTNIPQGSSQTPQLLASATGLSGTVDIHDDPGVIWTSSSTNVASVDLHGVVTGEGSGSATIIGTYGALSVTQAVSVFSLPVTMLHRYSFNETSGSTAHDSIDTSGNSDGTLNGDAAFDGNGQVHLDGTSGTWVDLPAHLLDASHVTANAVTIQLWATPSAVNGAYTRLFDFGNIAGANGANYIYCAPNTAIGTTNADGSLSGGGSMRFAVSDTSPGDTSEDGVTFNPNLLAHTNIDVVIVFNPNPSRKYLAMYTNGVLAASITTTKAYSAIVDDFNFIGRSTYSGDSWYNGSFNEFRIYNGELNKFQIAASDQSGVDATNFNVGTFTSFALNAGSQPIIAGDDRQIQAIMNFSLVTNVVVNGDSTLAFTSSSTNVANIDNAGNITPVNSGTTTITGIYGYVSGGTTTYYTNTVAVTFLSSSSTLIHRYSFTTDASDSVGGANGTNVMGSNSGITSGPTYSGGQLQFNNPNFSGPSSSANYVSLPPSVLPTSGGATIEEWFTMTGSGFFTESYAFGNDSDASPPTGAGGEYLAHTISAPQGGPVPSGGGNHVVQSHDGYLVGPELDAFGTTPGIGAGGGGYLDNGDTCFSATVISADGTLSYYLYDITAGLGGLQQTISGYPLSSFNFTHAYLGRSAFATDNATSGSMNEFRIYTGAKYSSEIAADFHAGPDTLLSSAPLVYASVSGGNVVITWTTNGTSAYTLQSSAVLGSGASWSTVGGASVVGSNYQATVPISGSSQFFRLSH